MGKRDRAKANTKATSRVWMKIITQPIFSMKMAKKCVEHFYVLQERLQIKHNFHLACLESLVRRVRIALINLILAFNSTLVFKSIRTRQSKRTFISLWQDMQGLAREYDISLYLSTPKHNDLRAYGNGLC